jgi:response regulator RpfG family c-di-GMP phosphodiesterase
METAALEDKRKILLIDDSEITLAMEKAVLEARGYEVVATSTLMEFAPLARVMLGEAVPVATLLPFTRMACPASPAVGVKVRNPAVVDPV